MVWKKGETGSKKGRSGRKTDAEIVQHYINTNLANSLIDDELKLLQDTPVKKRPHYKIKDVVMPIGIKNMVDRSENTIIMPKPLLNAIFDNTSNKKDSKPEEED
jgi:hypothetical protein